MISQDLGGITFQQIDVFLTAAKYENFTRTADELHMTTASVSRNIHALEDAIGVKLFLNQKQRVYLTAAGIKLSKEWRSLLKRAATSVDRVRDLQHEEQFVLRLGDGNAVPGSFYLFPIIEQFKNDHPEVTLNVTREEPSRVINGLIDRTYDVIFAISFAKQMTKTRVFKFTTIKTYAPKILVPKTHPLARKKHIAPEDICDYTVIAMGGTDYSGYWSSIEEILKNIHYPLDNMRSIPDAASIPVELLKGDSIAITTDLYAQVDKEYFCYLDIPSCTISWDLCLAYMPDNDNPGIKKFIASAKMTDTIS